MLYKADPNVFSGVHYAELRLRRVCDACDVTYTCSTRPVGVYVEIHGRHISAGHSAYGVDAGPGHVVFYDNTVTPIACTPKQAVSMMLLGES